MNHRQNYRQKQELERTALVALGLVSERYAGVSKIEFLMTYYRRGSNDVLMKRTLSFSSADYAGFHLKCMEEDCTGGGFDLGPAVAGLAKSHKKTTKGKVFCHGTNHTFGHASIAYEVNIQYHITTPSMLPGKGTSISCFLTRRTPKNPVTARK